MHSVSEAGPGDATRILVDDPTSLHALHERCATGAVDVCARRRGPR